LTQISIADLVLALAATGEGFTSGELDLALKRAINLDRAAGTVATSELTLNGADVTLTGALSGSDLNGSPKFTGNFKLAESSLRNLMALSAIPNTADPQALSRVSAEFGGQATTTSAALKPLSVKLDDSTFSGPALRFALNLDQIDLDRYMPPSSQESTTAPTAAPESTSSEDPLAALRPLDVAGSARIRQLKVVNLNTTDLGVDTESRGGVWNLNSIAAEPYEGKVSGNIRLDARKAVPKLERNSALNSIQISPLMTDFSGNEKLTVQGSVNVALRMQGLDSTKFKQTLNGTIGVTLNDGAYKGVDAIKTICSVGSKLETLVTGATGDLDESGDTEFSAMSATILSVDGVASNDDLDLKSPLTI
jgi:AsmA protein